MLISVKVVEFVGWEKFTESLNINLQDKQKVKIQKKYKNGLVARKMLLISELWLVVKYEYGNVLHIMVYMGKNSCTKL